MSFPRQLPPFFAEAEVLKRSNTLWEIYLLSTSSPSRPQLPLRNAAPPNLPRGQGRKVRQAVKLMVGVKSNVEEKSVHELVLYLLVVVKRRLHPLQRK